MKLLSIFGGVASNDRCPLMKRIEKVDISIIRKASKQLKAGHIPFGIASVGPYSLPLEEWKSLQDGNWLQDNVISAYGSILEKQYPTIISLDCAFISYVLNKNEGHQKGFSRRYGGANYLTRKHYIFVPLNQGKFHWTLFIINLQEPKFIWFDPLNSQDRAAEFSELRSLRNWFEHEIALHNSVQLPESFKKVSEWELISASGWPKQEDNHSCGVIVLQCRPAWRAVRIPAFMRRLLFECEQI